MPTVIKTGFWRTTAKPLKSELDLNNLIANGGTGTQEGYNESGTRAGQNLIVTLGDYDDTGFGTKVILNDNLATFDVQGSQFLMWNAEVNGVMSIDKGGTFRMENPISFSTDIGVLGTVTRFIDFPDASGVVSVYSDTTVPATDSSTGSKGEIRSDASHIYICTATDTWIRAALTAGW